MKRQFLTEQMKFNKHSKLINTPSFNLTLQDWLMWGFCNLTTTDILNQVTFCYGVLSYALWDIQQHSASIHEMPILPLSPIVKMKIRLQTLSNVPWSAKLLPVQIYWVNLHYSFCTILKITSSEVPTPIPNQDEFNSI